MYAFPAYASMLTDRMRVAAFREAITRTVTREHAILELGAGPGLFAVMAALQGAAKVYAIDPNPLVALAGLAAERNGVADRVDIHQCLSTKWTPGHPLDVVIHDLRGTLPFFRGNLRALNDVRSRMAPRATWIPACDRVYAALVACPAIRSELIDVWQDCDGSINAETYTTTAVNHWYKSKLKPEMIVSETRLLTTIDYASISACDLNASASWTATTSVKADGVAAWFESTLAEGVQYTSGPENPSSTYGQAFFPFPRPLTLASGDVIHWTLHAMDTGSDYIWWWNTKATSATGETLNARQGSLDFPFAPGLTD